MLATGRDRNAQLARWIALIGSVAGFLVTMPLYTSFDPLATAMQFVEHSPWIERFNMHYHLGVDGISMLLILLNSFTTPLVVIAGWEVIKQARGAVHGRVPDPVGHDQRRVLRARRDAVLRVLRGDADPDVHHHRRLGRPERVYAAVKFFLYTLLGSLLMLVALIYLYQVPGGSFAILD